MKITDLINGLAAKCGKQNEKSIIDLLSRTDLQNVDLADDVANVINNQLMTVDAAKNNFEVKNHFTATTLAPFDEKFVTAARTFGLTEDFVTELSGNKNTFDKFQKLNDKLTESFNALRASQGKGDDKAIQKYQEQINSLNAEMAKMKETYIPKSELEKVQKENDNAVRDYMLHSKIAGVQFANKDLAGDMNVELAKIVLQKALGNSKAVIVKDGNELKLKQAGDSALDYYDSSQKPVKFDDFMNKVFADNKLVAVSTPQNTPPAYTPQQFQPQNQPQINTAVIDAAIQSSISDLLN
jgi:hypothetical protein